MINITIKLEEKEIEIKGHAGYDVFGKDIVCAFCSGVFYNVIYTLEELKIIYKANIESGNSTLKMYGNSFYLQSIIKSAIRTYKQLETDYKSYVSLTVK